jgi:mRNA interferase RelE/StbE
VYKVRFNAHAQKAFRKLTRDVQARLKPAITALSLEPRPDGCRKLNGFEAVYRIRVGDFRVIYEVQDEVLVVLVLTAGHRRQVYRRFE